MAVDSLISILSLIDVNVIFFFNDVNVRKLICRGVIWNLQIVVDMIWKRYTAFIIASPFPPIDVILSCQKLGCFHSL